MEDKYGILITKVFKACLMSYSGMTHQEAIAYVKNENLATIEAKVKIRDICDTLLALYNKYFTKDHPLPTDSTIDIPSWKRMAVCILKNDHLCKYMGFAQTVRQTRREKELMEKYRRLQGD